MEKVLILKKYMGEGVEDTLFPNADNPIEIGAFRYDAKRMGGAPTITASVNYPSCLDGVWADNVYAEFNGEKFYLKQTPTSSYNNESTMYKHDLELVSERKILDDVYFFDVVVGDPQGSDKPVSNSTKVVFFGDVIEFASRLQASLEYSGLGYTVVVDEGVTSEEKLMSFEDQFFSNVLQEIYNTYEAPYYFDGKTIHIGYSKDVPTPTFSYGVDNALLSITKNNANYKIVNRATATGSSENIPFYYPNNSPKGDIRADVSNVDDSSFGVKITDYSKFSNEIALDATLVYQRMNYEVGGLTTKNNDYVSGQYLYAQFEGVFKNTYKLSFVAGNAGVMNLSLGYNIRNVEYPMKPLEYSSGNPEDILCRFTISIHNSLYGTSVAHKNVGAGDFLVRIPNGGLWDIVIEQELKTWGENSNQWTSAEYAMNIVHEGSYAGWFLDGKEYYLTDIGLNPIGSPKFGDSITQKLTRYVNTSQNLMPFKYRETDGDDRFYNAISGAYDGWVFNNPFVEGRPKEHIFSAEDIKPSIEGMEYNGQRIDMFEDIRFDDDDNDETYEDEEGNVYFKHPYFFAKLKPLGFNLFDHAIEQQPMTISFTKGDCGACNFEIAVDEDTQKNTVQVDENGDLIYVDGRVLCGAEGSGQGEVQPQDIQQDTTNRSVWIALRKEEDTYGILMPQYGKHEPSTEDTFVILGINLPYEYIEAAEKKLEAEIIKYLKDNNDEKFTFSIGFSRIFFEENPTILPLLSENSKIQISYNNKTYDLYVSSFAYSMSKGDVLPEISVELDETLKVSQNALQNAISQVKSELGRALGNIDVLGAATPYFIRKDADDEARGRINFTKGIKFGEGGKVEVLDNNSAKLTIEYLEVTKKASFTSLEIQEKTHVGGQILVTPAAINCGEVEEFGDFYRCYFQTKGQDDAEEIFNQFAIGDQAICQTYNAWGSKYYWRLVVGLGEDYIDLSKTDCDEESGVPRAGDKIIQLGNRSDVSRQNAIVIAAYGEGSPYIIQYKGIDGFEIPDSKIVTKLSSTENIFTGKVHMELGSDGLENLEGLPEVIEKQLESIEVGGQNMLRNSGFTGDYLSAQIADETILDQVDEMFNPPLVHWEDTNASVQDSVEAQSGKEVVLTNGSISQSLYQKVVANESYMLSFKAKGTSLTYSVGGVTKTIELTSDWMGYVEKIETITNGEVFSITTANCILCDLQLERGTVATAWGNSYLDNASDRLYYQAQQYVSDALRNATEGSTDIYGGLVLTRHIKVGDGSNTTDFRETGGMSGYFVDGNSPAFWAGGNFDTAAITAAKYETNTTTPEGEVPYVVTHGGKVVLNDAVVRGKVYAEEGVFSGFVKKAPTIINPSNYRDYLIADGDPMWFDLDLSKAGTFVVFEGEWADNPHFNMPQLNTTFVDHDSEGVPTSWKYYTLPRGYSIDEVFSLVGQKVIIMNKTNLNVQICTDSCSWIEPNNMGIYECEAKLYEDEVFDGMKKWSVNWKRQTHEIPDFTTIHPI